MLDAAFSEEDKKSTPPQSGVLQIKPNKPLNCSLPDPPLNSESFLNYDMIQ
jgi:hypothetical protein